MTLFVKEYENLTIETISCLTYENVIVETFSEASTIQLDDFIIMSRADQSYNSILEVSKYSFSIIIYEDFLKDISQNVTLEYCYKHDYYYLRDALLSLANSKVSTIISGSSYGAFGIDNAILKDSVNLSSISQDLYYSIQLVLHAWALNTGFKNVVLCIGYYTFYCDLSKVKSNDELSRISNVYYPLLNDSHHSTLLPPCVDFLGSSPVFDIRKIMNMYIHDDFQKGFFHKNRPRRQYATREWDDKSKDWNELTTTEKIKAGKRRAERHNKLIKRTLTFDENLQIFQSFVDFCTANNINILIVITPTTSYYNDYLNPKFKTDFYDAINKVVGCVHLLDLSDNFTSSDYDFNDTDHLSDSGAEKMSLYISEVLNDINDKKFIKPSE